MSRQHPTPRWSPTECYRIPENSSGPLAGYCHCGMMVMKGEDVCARCGEKPILTQTAPESVDLGKAKIVSRM